MTEPLLLHGLASSRTEALDLAEGVLRTCGMDASCMRKYPHEFSGGQKQRMAIARAVSLKPRLLVCDEPTSALDVSIQAQILNLLKDLQREHGIAYLFISLDMGVIDYMCDHVMVMRHGKVVESGEREQVIQNPAADYTRELLSAVPGR
jgi:ABC-type microcin C transport system duplicated ATPase subunit YejF